MLIMGSSAGQGTKDASSACATSLHPLAGDLLRQADELDSALLAARAAGADAPFGGLPGAVDVAPILPGAPAELSSKPLF